jgi:hypothetical protein
MGTEAANLRGVFQNQPESYPARKFGLHALVKGDQIAHDALSL